MFDCILGHDKQKKMFEDVLKNKNISHSYLFFGRKGIGKGMFAKQLAMQILNTDNLKSCPDYKYISKREDKKDIIIEQIREELIDDVYISPASSDYKVYIIDDAENLNIAAQNALLKTLEEPPQYVVIILVSSTINSFLPTILSRVSKVSFDNINNELVNKYILQNYNITLDEDVISYINGSIGLCDEIINNELVEKFNLIRKIYDSVVNKERILTLNMAKDVDFSNTILIDFLEHIFYINKRYECIRFVEKAKQRLKFNGNYDIVIDTMFLKIIDVI